MHGRCGPEENDEGLSLRFVCRGFCTALQARPQATIKSPFRTCLHRLKAQVQRSQRCCGPLAALSRGANALLPLQPGVSAGVPVCMCGSCCGVKHASHSRAPGLGGLTHVWGWARTLRPVRPPSHTVLPVRCAGTRRSHKPPELHAATKKRIRETCAHKNDPPGRSQRCLHV